MNDLEALAAYLSEARTIREIAARFSVSKPTAITWLAQLQLEKGLTTKIETRRDGKRGPLAKTYRLPPT